MRKMKDAISELPLTQEIIKINAMIYAEIGDKKKE
jgi:hypothetical protein